MVFDASKYVWLKGWQCEVHEYGNRGPFIFLLDEFHPSYPTILDNIEIAKLLVKHLNVGLIGVENYSSKIDPYDGGLYWDESPDRADISGVDPIGSEIRFAQGVNSIGVPVVGIDSNGYHMVLDCEVAPAERPEHPANISRSRNFVLSLFQERLDRQLECNLLINCGSNHCKHILNIVGNPASAPDNWPNGTYVRLRSPKFPP